MRLGCDLVMRNQSKVEAMPERPLDPRRIAFDSYGPHLEEIQHLFLVGDLRLPTPHPFFRDSRVEMILATYDAGDDGQFHWHREVTEYEMILEGTIGYQHASDGRTILFGPGDLSLVAEGECVRRLVPARSRTLAIKVPSRPGDKVHCDQCGRDCTFRQMPGPQAGP